MWRFMEQLVNNFKPVLCEVNISNWSIAEWQLLSLIEIDKLHVFYFFADLFGRPTGEPKWNTNPV